MKVFHYTFDTHWDEIVSGSDKGRGRPGKRGQPGLAATKNMGKYDQEAWETRAVFALLSPLPSSWTDNPYFKKAWKYLFSDIGKVMLEIDINPQTDNAYVVDRAHIEGFLDEDNKTVPEQFQHKTRREAERNYMLSRVHLGDYLRVDSFNYSLPEVIIPQHVPLDKISVSSQQPLLELKLNMEELKYATADSIVNGHMKNELMPWRQAYETAHGSLEGLIKPKENIIEILNRRRLLNERTSTIGHEREIRL